MTTGENINGIDVEQLDKTISQIKRNNNIAKFRFQAESRWVNGSHSRAVATSFYGASRSKSGASPTSSAPEKPVFLLGGTAGPNPAEYLLVGLAGCLTASMATHAATRNIKLNALSCHIEGDVDLQGFLGISELVPVGFREIRACFDIDADISDEKKEELIRITRKFSPVLNTISKPTSITCELMKTHHNRPGEASLSA